MQTIFWTIIFNLTTQIVLCLTLAVDDLGTS